MNMLLNILWGLVTAFLVILMLESGSFVELLSACLALVLFGMLFTLLSSGMTIKSNQEEIAKRQDIIIKMLKEDGKGSLESSEDLVKYA